MGEYDSGGMMTKVYGWKPDGLWGTDPLYMVEGGAFYFYHNDHLGTPQKLTGMNRLVAWSAVYEAFGEAAVDASSSVVNTLRFPGQYFDAETGEHYNFQRYYDPKSGRYTQADPIGLKMGKNLYGYVLRNPLNILDPLGLSGVPLGYRPYTQIEDGVAGYIETEILPMVDSSGKPIFEMAAKVHDGIVGGYYLAPKGYHYDENKKKYIYGMSSKEKYCFYYSKCISKRADEASIVGNLMNLYSGGALIEVGGGVALIATAVGISNGVLTFSICEQSIGANEAITTASIYNTILNTLAPSKAHKFADITISAIDRVLQEMPSE